MRGEVGVTRIGAVGFLELDAPQPNYLDPELMEHVVEAVEALDRDPDCRAVVLASTGRHFCAGADFGESGGIGPDRPASARRLYGAAARLFDVAVPIIAVVQGAAVGAGLGLACAADFRVAAASSRFHANFTRLGLHPGFALTLTLPEIVGMQAASDLLYSGRRIDGTEAGAIGLVDRLVAEDDLRSAALSWAAEISESAPLAVRAVKRTLRGSRADAVRSTLEHELGQQTWLWETEDWEAGLRAAAERRTPTFRGR